MVNCVGLLYLAFGQAGLAEGVLAQLGGSDLCPSLRVVNRVVIPAQAFPSPVRNAKTVELAALGFASEVGTFAVEGCGWDMTSRYPLAYAARATARALALDGNGPLLPHIHPALVWRKGILNQASLLLFDRLRSEHLPLGVCLLYALAGNLKIFGFALYADEVAPHLSAGHAGGAAAHEGIKYRLRVSRLLKTPQHQR